MKSKTNQKFANPKKVAKALQDSAPKLTPEEKEKMKAEELSNLNKNLMKKLYLDLYTQNIDLYQEKNMTFENFLFRFYKMIEDSIDYENPNYPLLLRRIDIKIKASFEEENILTPDLNSKEIRKNLNKLSQEDEWALIYKYQSAINKDKEQKEKEEKKRELEKYQADLDNQIMKKKAYVDEVQKKKDEIYLFKEKEAKTELEKIKINNQLKIENIRRKNDNRISKEIINNLEEQNLDINDNNKEVINFKIDYLLNLPLPVTDEENGPKKIIGDKSEEQQTIELIGQISKENDIKKIKKILNNNEYKKELEVQIYDKIKNHPRPDKMSNEERKMNSKLLQESREYFKNKKI